MRVEALAIKKYRSIENVVLRFPEKKPVVLFGPNNAGKSNILSALHRVIGERYPTYIEMQESDYFMRNPVSYPTSEIIVKFSEPLYFDNRGNGQNVVAVTYGRNGVRHENLLHDGMGNKIYPTNEQRAGCQSFLIDAERNIQSAFNYSSSYSLLSKFSKKIHTALSTDHKQELETIFEQIKGAFEKTDEFQDFFDAFSASMSSAVKGFVHSLAVDFSAYDPNNYAKSLRIYAKEGESIRSFEEFGTGEQQVLLMAFVKAYMEVFNGESFVLIIEEPEAHLHPLAQKWLKEYVVEMCNAGIQVVISTHSTEFIDAEYLDGLVRVYKDDNATKAIQLTPEKLCEYCISSGVPADRISKESVVDFYATKIFGDQLKGMFAETIILVEGATEYFSIPIYLKNAGFSLSEHGIEIINCRGKDSIPLYWRLFNAYGYRCFAIFDCDRNSDKTKNVFSGIFDNEWQTESSVCEVTNEYAYFGKDFETYLRNVVDGYEELEKEVSETYQITSKPGKAKAVAQHLEIIPEFIEDIIKCLNDTQKTVEDE